MLRRRPALMLYTSVALLPILTLLFSSAMRVLFGKGDFALVFGELERTVLPILRAMRESDSVSGFFASAAPEIRAGALLLSFSPLNLPMLLLPLSALRTAVMLSLSLRLSLAALSMAFFLRKIGCKPLPTLALSLAYALSSYATVGAALPSYLDALILFPFVVLGILRIARGQGGSLFGAALGLSILICPAVAAALAVFSILLYVYFKIVVVCPKRSSLPSVAVFVSMLLLGAVSALAALMPFLSLAKFSPSDYPFVQALDFLDFCAKLLPGGFDGLSDAALPYLSVGVLPLLLSVVFFTAKAIPSRIRIATGGLWFLLFFSFTVSAINGLYSLFIPSLPPYGHAFIFVFLLTATGAYAWPYLSEKHERTLILSSGVIVLFAMLLQKLKPTYELVVEERTLAYGYISELAILWIPMLAAILLTAAITMIVRAEALRERISRAAVALLVLTICAEGALSSYALVKGAEKHRGESYLSDADYSRAFSESVLSALALTEEQELYRVISSSALTDDDGLYFGYHSLTALPEPILSGLGITLDDRGRFVSTDYPLVLALLGVRHYVERIRIQIGETKDGEPIYDQPTALSEAIRGYFDAGYTVLGDEEEATTLLTSSLALPLLFASHSDLSHLDMMADGSVISLLNSYFRLATGNPSLSLYEELETSSIFGSKAEQNCEGYTVYSGSRIRIKTTVQSDAPLYLLLSTEYPRRSTVSITANGTTLTYPLYEDMREEQSATVLLGSFAEGTAIEVAINYPDSSDGCFYLPVGGSLLWQESPSSIRQAVLLLASRGATDITYAGDTLSATVVTSGESAILTTLPADYGFTVKVDGKTVETSRALGAFLAIPISSDGEHRITLTMHEPAETAPTLLSAFGAAALAALAVLELLVFRGRLSLPYLSRKRKNADAEVDEA